MHVKIPARRLAADCILQEISPTVGRADVKQSGALALSIHVGGGEGSPDRGKASAEGADPPRSASLAGGEAEDGGARQLAAEATANRSTSPDLAPASSPGLGGGGTGRFHQCDAEIGLGTVQWRSHLVSQCESYHCSVSSFCRVHAVTVRIFHCFHYVPFYVGIPGISTSILEESAHQ
jgi:hypothetical protein